VSNSKNTKVKGLLVGLAGAALLLGGSTYALWSSEGTVTGSAAITAGDLVLSAAPATGIYDTSTDRLDSKTDTDTAKDLSTLAGCLPSGTYTGHATPDGWNMVPGDSVVQVYPFKAALKGDNLVAKMTADFGTVSTSSTFATAVEGYLKVYVNGTEISSTDIQDIKTKGNGEVVGFFQAPSQSGKDDGTLPKLPATATDYNMCVALVMTWDKDSTGKAANPNTGKVTGTTDVNADIVKLTNGLKISLVQSRNAAEVDAWKGSSNNTQFNA
jgi:alternate signal-mediated exported protein